MHNAVSISRFNRILNAADVIFDPASSEFIGTTIPYNPFGDYRVPIASNTPSIDLATVHPKEVDISKLATIDFSIYTTQLFKLPAGGVGFVLGGQFRRESLSQDPDLLGLDRDLFGESTAGAGDHHPFSRSAKPCFIYSRWQKGLRGVRGD